MTATNKNSKMNKTNANATTTRKSKSEGQTNNRATTAPKAPSRGSKVASTTGQAGKTTSGQKKPVVVVQEKGVSQNARQKKGVDVSFVKLEGPYLSWTEAEDQVRRLLNKKAEISTTDFKHDTYNVFVVTNLWCCLLDDYNSPISGITLSSRIRLIGLQAVIDEADRARNSYTHQIPIDGFWQAIEDLRIRDVLTLLGFPKRIRLATIDHHDNIQEWLEENRRHAFYGYDRRGDDRFVSSKQQEVALNATPRHDYVMEMLALEFADIFKNYQRDDSLFVLPPGATYEGCSSYMDKLHVAFSHQVWLRQYGVNIPWWPHPQKLVVPDTNRLIVVPKNYKTGRLVCPEPVVRQIRGYQVSEGMYRCLKQHGVDTRNQELNRNAIVGDHDVATIDLHAASDSLSVNFICSITRYTPTLYGDLFLSRSSFTLVNGQLIRNHHWMTMGNTCTFNLESGVFLAFVRLACRWAATGKRFSYKKFSNLLDRCHVYGDDIEVPNDVAPLLIDLLSMMGFVVNEGKTFYGDLPYRESCGCETWNGRDVTGLYWPRGTSQIPFAELISMQHKLFDKQRCNGFLVRLILDVFPKVRTAVPGSAYSDIWDYAAAYLPSDKPKSSPYAICRETYKVTYLSLTDANKRQIRLGVSPTSLLDEMVLIRPISDLPIEEDIRQSMEGIVVYKIRKINRKWFSQEKPDCDDYELHTLITSRSTGVIPESERPFAEFCFYYLTLGHAIEHINGSPFTKPQDNVSCIEDLFASRLVYVTNKRELR